MFVHVSGLLDVKGQLKRKKQINRQKIYAEWYIDICTGWLKKIWVLPIWAFADLSRISKVFLPNWQQDLQMLNLAKLSFFWDTLYEKVSDVVESRIRFIHHFIHHTYSKNWINLDWVFWLLFGDFWGREKDYIASLTIFKIWVFSATFLHEITLYAIDIDKKRFRTPFLTL